MEIHTCLWNEVDAFNFNENDLRALQQARPGDHFIYHGSNESFTSVAATAECLLTWNFPAKWYGICTNLQQIITPAAGNDWISPDPNNRVRITHGHFHGGLLSESVLHAILHMNHHMPAMQSNFSARSWNRNLQASSRLISTQEILIVGLGHIGLACAELLRSTGASVTGIRRSVSGANSDIPVYPVSELDLRVAQADHIVLLLPGGPETERLFNERRLRLCKPGAYIYNFGRGNALHAEDLINAWDHLGGAFLDVTEVEPLPETSKLWELGNIMITPHSSCVFEDYRRLFVKETLVTLGNADKAHAN